MLVIILLLTFIAIVYKRKHDEIYKGINEINDISAQIEARYTLSTYKVYMISCTITILIILLYTILTWH